MRLFVGISLKPDVLEHVADFKDRLGSSLDPLSGVKLRWQTRAQLHVTLKFLGETPQSRVPELNEAIEKVRECLKEEGFGVLTEIDVKNTLKKKLDADFRNYIILGACNPPYAYQALQSERMIGTMLPCNVIVQDTENGKIEVAAVDPLASMQAINNPSLGEVAQEVRQKLKRVIERL